MLLLLLGYGLAQEVSGPACPAEVEALPAVSWLEPEDRRLQGEALIVVLKSSRRVGLYSGGKLADEGACWPIGLGGAPEGHKRREGDQRTPEGWYRSSDKPASRYYGAIAVHYPNAADAAAGVADGRIDAATRRQIEAALARDEKPPQGTALGGEILIHGGGSWTDWTLGCVAMDNDELDDLRARLPAGKRTDILILP